MSLNDTPQGEREIIALVRAMGIPMLTVFNKAEFLPLTSFSMLFAHYKGDLKIPRWLRQHTGREHVRVSFEVHTNRRSPCWKMLMSFRRR